MAESAKVNSNFSDISAALTASIAKDGQTTPTANLPMGGFKLTGLGAGSASTDSVTLGQVQAQAYIWCNPTAGTANAQTATPSPAITAYAAGQMFRVLIGAGLTNTGAATLAVSGLASPKNIKRLNGTALVGGELVAGQVYDLAYDGTNFVILTPGDRALIAETALTAVSSISFTSIPTYFNRIRLEMSGIKVGTDNVSLYLRLSEAGVFKSGVTDYQYAHVVLARGSTTTQQEASAAQILLGTAIGNATGEGADGYVILHRPADVGATVVNHSVEGRLNVADAGSVLINNIICGNRANATPVAQDGIRILPSSGSFGTAGKLQLWGEI